MARALNDIMAGIGLGFTAVDLTTLPEAQRTWAQKFATRGYVLVEDDAGSLSWLHPETEAYLPGSPENEGVNVALWDNFFNPFTREDFATDEEYLDAVENRFRTLWAAYDED